MPKVAIAVKGQGMEEELSSARLSEIEKHPQDFRLLERVPFTKESFLNQLPQRIVESYAEDQTFPIVFLDTETTGLKVAENKIIQLSMVRCSYSVDLKTIVSVDACFDGFEDPGEPLPQEIVELTGITDEMVRGKHFDENRIRQFITPGTLVVAHNAGFDRPFFDKRFKDVMPINDMPWACSLEEIDWRMLGFYGTKLEFLASSLGYFYDAHLAINDALSLCFIMCKVPAALDSLMTSAAQSSFKLEVKDTDIKIKDQLKAWNFRWDSGLRLWYIASHDANFIADILHKVQGLINQSGKGEIVLNKFAATERYRLQVYGQ